MTQPPPKPGSRYTFLHHQAGLCTLEEIGTTVPDPSATPAPTPPPDPMSDADTSAALPDMASMSDAEIAQTTVRLLREATVEVFHRLGGTAWLYDLARSNPKEYLKVLQRLLPQSIEQTVTVQPFVVPKHIASLTLDDLRAMRAQPQQQIIDVEFEEVRR